MTNINDEAGKMFVAIHRARHSIISIAILHIIVVAIGIVMVHTGNGFALAYRDRLVAQALTSDPVSLASQRGDNLQAALIETVRTEWACVATGLTGLTVISPYIISSYRAWVGGIVSVSNTHLSRLIEARKATYYLVTVILQLIPYTLAAGAGVNLGLAYFRSREEYQGDKWIGYPKEAIKDFIRIIVLIVPLVLVANFWEFLSPLNR